MSIPPERGHNRVCIIGGGFTGLAAATDLVQAGCSVTLFEARDSLGGLASGFTELGWQSSAEYIYHHWFESDFTVRDYAHIWGLANGIEYIPVRTVFETRSGKFVPLDSASALLSFPDIPLSARLRTGLALAYLRMTGNWPALEKTTAAEWCTKHMGREAFEVIWQPMLEHKFGKHYADQANMAFLWARLHIRSAYLGTCTGGIRTLVDKAREWLESRGVEVRLNSRIDSVSPGKDGQLIVQSESTVTPCDAVIAAVDPPAFLRMAGSLDEDYSEILRQSSFLGCQVILLRLSRPFGSDGVYWYNLQPREGSFAVIVDHAQFVPRLLYNGESLVYVARYLPPDAPEWNLSDSEITRQALECLARVSPGVGESDVIAAYVQRVSYAQPVRLVKASGDIPPLAVEGCPGLFHASMAHIYPWDRGVNYALVWGSQAAAVCIEYLIERS